MIFVDPKTGKEYKSVIEAARATLCPGPCIDCPLRDMSSQGQSYQVNAERCTLWAYDHPTAFAERMGLTIKPIPVGDMSLDDIRAMCVMRHGEFGKNACDVCDLYNHEIEDCFFGQRVSPRGWELYTGLQFPDFNDRKWLNGIYDVYGPQLTIRRYSEDSLVAIKSDGRVYQLPFECLPRLSAQSSFSLDEARKNKFMFVSLQHHTPAEKAPDRQPSFGPTGGCNGQPQQIQQEGQ